MSLALVDFDLSKLIEKKIIFSKEFKLKKYVQPASIDIPIGSKAYLVKQKFLPFSQKISSLSKKLALEELDLNKETLLFKGQTYLIPVLDLNLPKEYSIRISPKSSIGRIDLMVRAIFDKLGLYDTVLPRSKGQLWLEVTPQSFNVKIKKGICLNQLMVFSSSNTSYNCNEKSFLYDEKRKKLKQDTYNNNKLILNLNVPKNGIVGYEAVSTNEVIDLTSRKTKPNKFFREITKSKKENAITLEKDRFYILSTKQFISIPGEVSAEMIPFSHLIGELRAHYAGFFDPGFGYDKPASGVLEIRPHETLTVYDGQPICLMEFFQNKSLPKELYGKKGNNYQYQKGPKLAKFFSKF